VTHRFQRTPRSQTPLSLEPDCDSILPRTTRFDYYLIACTQPRCSYGMQSCQFVAWRFHDLKHKSLHEHLVKMLLLDGLRNWTISLCHAFPGSYLEEGCFGHAFPGCSLEESWLSRRILDTRSEESYPCRGFPGSCAEEGSISRPLEQAKMTGAVGTGSRY
jgi:hypothetical protein